MDKTMPACQVKLGYLPAAQFYYKKLLCIGSYVKITR
jgi:hypothetical protein